MDFQLEKPSKKVNFFSAIFLIIFTLGLPLLSYGAFLKYQKTVLSFSGEEPAPEFSQIRKEKPVRVEIKRLGIDLTVSEGEIVNGIWQISVIGLSHLESSARPGEGGNIVIYGHNKKTILGPVIGRIKVGDKIFVYSESGQTTLYEVSEVMVVSSSEIKVVYPTEKEILTLYTCTGLLDSKRLVIKALPIAPKPV